MKKYIFVTLWLLISVNSYAQLQGDEGGTTALYWQCHAKNWLFWAPGKSSGCSAWSSEGAAEVLTVSTAFLNHEIYKYTENCDYYGNDTHTDGPAGLHENPTWPVEAGHVVNTPTWSAVSEIQGTISWESQQYGNGSTNKGPYWGIIGNCF